VVRIIKGYIVLLPLKHTVSLEHGIICILSEYYGASKKKRLEKKYVNAFRLSRKMFCFENVSPENLCFRFS